MNKLEIPMNTQERYLHGINIRLDAIIAMMSSFIEVYAKQNELATTSNEVVEEIKEVKTKKTKK
jgi:uncharacterized protein YrrD